MHDPGGHDVPTRPAAADGSAVELGLRFTPQVDGFVTGVRFYKGAGNVGTHIGSLWSATGTRLATATFADESATGWQQVSFTSAVAVSAGQTYVVSYSAPQGHYAVQPGAFWSSGIDAPPLQVEGGYGTSPAGVYGDLGRFPGSSYQRGGYCVDVAVHHDRHLAAHDHGPVARPRLHVGAVDHHHHGQALAGRVRRGRASASARPAGLRSPARRRTRPARAP